MMKKSTMHIMHIRIGLKVLFLALGIFPLSSCIRFFEDDGTKEQFEVLIKNNTYDTLVINNHGSGKTIFESYLELESKIIYPDSTIKYSDNIFPKGKQPLAVFFNGANKNDSCWIYHFDDYLKEKVNDSTSRWFSPPPTTSSAVAWDAPLRNMNDSIHHFYNHQSWDITFIEVEGGWDKYQLLFIITADDLK